MEEKGGEIKNGLSHWKLPMQAHRRLDRRLDRLTLLKGVSMRAGALGSQLSEVCFRIT